MDKELKKLIDDFYTKLKEYEKKNTVFIEIWRSQISADTSLRVEIKTTFK